VFGPPLAFVALWAADRRDRAESFARGFGTATGSAQGARRRLALVTRTAGLTGASADILASLPDDHSPALEALRSRTAFDDGRYTDALALARAAVAGGVPGAQELVARADAFLTVLDPGWLPDLGPAAVRPAHRPDPIRGRVLHIVRSSLPYTQAGYTIRTRSVAQCQLGAGLDPHVMTRAGYPRSEGVAAFAPEERIDGIPHHRVAPRFVDDGRPDRLVIETARAAAPLVEALRPAVLQPATNHLQAQVALALARPLGIPVVYEVRGFWEETWLAVPSRDEAEAMEAERYRLTRAVETAAMLGCDAVVTLSETMRREIIARGCAPEKVVVVPNAVEIDRFVPVPRNDALGASLGIDRSDTVVGYVSTFTHYEGVPYLLDAAARLRDQRRPVRVLLVGDGADMEAIAAAGRRLGLDDGTLIMTGRVPHSRILDYYSLIDVFVVPRTADRVSQMVTPLKPYEAMALERTVVVSDLPALREIVTPGETGLTFRPEDPDDLARVLGELLDDPALRVRLGRQAREWIATERTWAQNGRRYRELFERLGAA
jgi:glycosyltransferase involved in cell wall biosynthesis